MLTSEKFCFVVRTKSKQTFCCKEQNVDLCKFGKTSRNKKTARKNVQGSRIKRYLACKGLRSTAPCQTPHTSLATSTHVTKQQAQYKKKFQTDTFTTVYPKSLPFVSHCKCPPPICQHPKIQRKNNCWAGLAEYISANFKKKIKMKSSGREFNRMSKNSSLTYKLNFMNVFEVFHVVSRSHILSAQTVPWNLQKINTVGFFLLANCIAHEPHFTL